MGSLELYLWGARMKKPAIVFNMFAIALFASSAGYGAASNQEGDPGVVFLKPGTGPKRKVDGPYLNELALSLQQSLFSIPGNHLLSPVSEADKNKLKQFFVSAKKYFNDIGILNRDELKAIASSYSAIESAYMSFITLRNDMFKHGIAPAFPEGSSEIQKGVRTFSDLKEMNADLGKIHIRGIKSKESKLQSILGKVTSIAVRQQTELPNAGSSVRDRRNLLYSLSYGLQIGIETYLDHMKRLEQYLEGQR